MSPKCPTMSQRQEATASFISYPIGMLKESTTAVSLGLGHWAGLTAAKPVPSEYNYNNVIIIIVIIIIRITF